MSEEPRFDEQGRRLTWALRRQLRQEETTKQIQQDFAKASSRIRLPSDVKLEIKPYRFSRGLGFYRSSTKTIFLSTETYSRQTLIHEMTHARGVHHHGEFGSRVDTDVISGRVASVIFGEEERKRKWLRRGLKK